MEFNLIGLTFTTTVKLVSIKIINCHVLSFCQLTKIIWRIIFNFSYTVYTHRACLYVSHRPVHIYIYTVPVEIKYILIMLASFKLYIRTKNKNTTAICIYCTYHSGKIRANYSLYRYIHI